jgi:hypothetical protein
MEFVPYPPPKNLGTITMSLVLVVLAIIGAVLLIAP